MSHDRRHNHPKTTEGDKSVLVHACVQCAISEGWDSPEALAPEASDERYAFVHAGHAAEYKALGYETFYSAPVFATDSGMVFLCPHLLPNATEMSVGSAEYVGEAAIVDGQLDIGGLKVDLAGSEWGEGVSVYVRRVTESIRPELVGAVAEIAMACHGGLAEEDLEAGVDDQ